MARSKLAQSLPQYVSIATLAKLLKLSEPTLRALIKAGVLKETEKGALELLPTMEAYFAFKFSPAKSPRLRLDQERIRKLRLSNDRAEAKLIRHGDAKAALSAALAALLSRIDTLPNNAAARFTQPETVEAVRQYVQEEVARVRGVAADEVLNDDLLASFDLAALLTAPTVPHT